ncbi:MAG: transporter related [Clostridiales bacterium]|jgi:ABC-type multidrug transport system fused ATPase/permease subunit|nr:transporter related [Clostridiales bacterium]
MKELLLKRKIKFFLYLFATFLFNVDHFVQIGIFALIVGAIEKGDMKYYRIVVIITIISVIYSALTFLISRLLRIEYMRDTIFDVRMQAFDKIINMSFKRFSKKSKEVYISNLINDVNLFEKKFFISLLNFLINGGLVVMCLITLIVIDYKVAIAMSFISLILFVIANFFAKKTLELQKEVSTVNEEFTTEISNTFNGIEILKLNNIEEKFLNKSLHTISKVEKKKYMSNIFTELQRNIIRFLGYIIMVGAMVYLAYAVSDGMKLATAMIVFQLCNMASFNLIEAFPLWNVIKSSVEIYNKITQPDELEEQVSEGKEFIFNEKIEVKGIDFSFENKVILENAKFTIEKGKKYLIKGASGAGKSTLMKVLSMTYDEYTGDMEVDGVNFKDIAEKSFNSKVSFVYQDVFLFEDSIKNNISLYKNIPDERINQAIKICGLESVIDEKKGGINEKLMENGKNLSGGQRQRISIARAIAKNAEILFIDEGTSSLNEDLGRDIEKLLLELDNTVISISHRFYEDVTDKYDYVLEMKNGHVNKYPAKDYFGEVITC